MHCKKKSLVHFRSRQPSTHAQTHISLPPDNMPLINTAAEAGPRCYQVECHWAGRRLWHKLHFTSICHFSLSLPAVTERGQIGKNSPAANICILSSVIGATLIFLWSKSRSLVVADPAAPYQLEVWHLSDVNSKYLPVSSGESSFRSESCSSTWLQSTVRSVFRLWREMYLDQLFKYCKDFLFMLSDDLDLSSHIHDIAILYKTL